MSNKLFPTAFLVIFNQASYSSSGFENMLLEPLALAPFDLAVTPAVLRWFSGTRSGWPARDLHDSQWRERSKWLKKCSQKLAHKSPTTVLLGHWLAPNGVLDTKSMKSAWVFSSKRNIIFFKVAWSVTWCCTPLFSTLHLPYLPQIPASAFYCR